MPSVFPQICPCASCRLDYNCNSWKQKTSLQINSHAYEKILARCRIKWLKDLIKLYVLNLSWDAWQGGETKPNSQVWNIEKCFLVLFSHNSSLLPETPLLSFLMGRCSGGAFSASGNFTLSFSFQLEKKNLCSAWCPEHFRCCICLNAKEWNISIHGLPREQTLLFWRGCRL